MKTEVEILEAQEFACEYFNMPRRKFVELVAVRYGSNKPCFIAAVHAYDEIQQDMAQIYGEAV